MNKKKFKILIVEDEAINFLYLQRILSDKNTTILHAKNGKDAVNNIKKYNDIDCILLDIKLPDKNGLEIAEEIKKIKNIPIIIQTAYDINNYKRNNFTRYADEFLSKPIMRDQLMKLIDKYKK
ncbi:MAG: response regulator [Spirochaetes bacterium]|nr:response regulator [Spirochaetota bacterium]